jgi:sialic acid synthase SpsE
MKTLKINKSKIDNQSKVFIIAEAGVNHNGNLQLAKKLCKAAKNAGADAIKFQTWKTRDLITRTVRTPTYQKITTGEDSQFVMLKRLELSFTYFKEIFRYCKKIGIIFLSTPGDKTSVNFLKSLRVPAYKIGSDDMDNFPLLKYVAQKKKPLIISTGMSYMKEVEKSFNFVKKFNKKIAFLHCTSSYPTDLGEVNMKSILTMKRRLKTIIGYSDHTTNIWIPILAICLGAKIIEKHITIDKNLPGPDHKSSLTPVEFQQMVELIRKTELKLKNDRPSFIDIQNFLHVIISDLSNNKIKSALGSSIKKPTSSETKIMNFVKKTIVAAVDIKKGDKLSERNLTIKRAGQISLKPTEYFDLINKIATKNIKKDEIVDYEKCK